VYLNLVYLRHCWDTFSSHSSHKTKSARPLVHQQKFYNVWQIKDINNGIDPTNTLVGRLIYCRSKHQPGGRCPHLLTIKINHPALSINKSPHCHTIKLYKKKLVYNSELVLGRAVNRPLISSRVVKLVSIA